MSQCTPCENIGYCEDSELSTTGSLLRIITFVYVILATVNILILRFRSADHERAQLMNSISAKLRCFRQMESQIEKRLNVSTVDPDLRDLMRSQLVEGARVMDSLHNGIRFDAGWGRASRLKQRGKFVLNQEQLKELLQKIDAALSDLSALLGEASQEYEIHIHFDISCHMTC